MGDLPAQCHPGAGPGPGRDDLDVVHEAVHQRETTAALVGAARWPPLAFVLDDHDEPAVVVPGPDDELTGAARIRVLDRVRRRLVHGQRDLRPDLGRRALPVEPPRQGLTDAVQLLRLRGDPHLELVRGPVLPLGHGTRVRAAGREIRHLRPRPRRWLRVRGRLTVRSCSWCWMNGLAREGNTMKKLVAAVTVAGVLVAGGGTAWAAQPDGSGGSGASGGGAAQQGRRGHGARLALQTAATTIGVSPEDLAAQIRGGKTVAAVAGEHNVDPATVVNAVVAALNQRIDQAAAGGKIDADRAAKAKEKVPDLANRFVNETKSKRSGEGRRHRVLGEALNAAAKEIGVSEADLKQALKDGNKSIAQVAKEHDKSADDVVDAIVKKATSAIDQAVKDGKLDSKKADEIKQKLPDRAKQFVNRERQGGSSATPTT